MKERISNTSPRRKMDTTKGHFTQRNEVRNSIRRMKHFRTGISLKFCLHFW